MSENAVQSQVHYVKVILSYTHQMQGGIIDFWRKKFEFFLVLLLLFGTVWLRFENLVAVPGGFHGDEAVVGLEAQHILREGSIGLYSPLALGQPTLPFYLTALSISLFGPTIWAVRAVSAFLGTITVLLLYLLLRRHQGRTIAVVGATLLSTLDWHIHFSRVGFPVIAWPLCAVATTFAALEAVKRQQGRWWAVTGLLAGVGIYCYNAHILWVIALGVWFLFYLVREHEVTLVRRAKWLVCFGVALVVVALPMVRYALNPANDYFSHTRSVSLFNAPESNWQEQENEFAQIKFLVERAFGFWDNLSWHSQTDPGDSSGVVPVVPLGLLVLAGVGLVLSRKSPRDDLRGMSLCCVLLMPLGPIFTVNGFTRRAFALSPFLAFLSAVGVVEIWKWACSSTGKAETSKTRSVLVTGTLMALCGLLVWQNLSDYFDRFAPSPQRVWSFAQDFTEMCTFLNTLPPKSHVLFYSDRWSCNYETRRFLAPNIQIEDRSSEFGTFSFWVNQKSDLSTIVLMGKYRKRLQELQKIYPYAQFQLGPPNTEHSQPAFIVVWPYPF